MTKSTGEDESRISRYFGDDKSGITSVSRG